MVQHRHPLLSARVVDDPGETGAAPAHFARSELAISIRIETSAGWEQVVGQELAMPFEVGAGPLARTVLISAPSTGDRPAFGPGDGSDLLVLTLSHTIADGFSARLVLEEAVAVLNGRALPSRPVPVSQESMLDQLKPSAAPTADGSAATDPRPAAPAWWKCVAPGSGRTIRPST